MMRKYRVNDRYARNSDTSGMWGKTKRQHSSLKSGLSGGNVEWRETRGRGALTVNTTRSSPSIEILGFKEKATRSKNSHDGWGMGCVASEWIDKAVWLWNEL